MTRPRDPKISQKTPGSGLMPPPVRIGGVAIEAVEIYGNRRLQTLLRIRSEDKNFLTEILLKPTEAFRLMGFFLEICRHIGAEKFSPEK